MSKYLEHMLVECPPATLEIALFLSLLSAVVL